MADPISLFPEYVRNQVFPPTGGTGTTLCVELNVTLEDNEITVQIEEDDVIPVMLPDGLTICIEN
jgi:hypothetical protein